MAPDLAIVTSWDDGHPSDMRLAGMLARHSLRGTFFVPQFNSEGRAVLDRGAVVELAAAGFEIGCHTRDHVRLAALGPGDIARQIGDGRRYIEDIIGRAVVGFAYPGGHPGIHGKRIAAQSGLSYARTTRMFCLDPGADPFLMPTTMQLYPHRLAALARNLLRNSGRIERLRVAALRMRATSLEAAVDALAAHALARGGVLHIWGHSWEFDELELWPQIDRILARLAATLVAARRATAGECALCA